MEQVISLYKEEIATYQQQIEELKQRNRDCDQRNAALINKVQNLEDLVEKANVANRDLNIAFEHVHQENLRLQVKANNQDSLVANNTKQVAETNSRKEELAADSLVWMSEREQFKQRNKFLERECERYHRDNMHLGKQVRHLLKTLEEERGMIIRRQSQVTQDNQIMCAADVIDKHLITFESIEELQQQNQKLLSLVKNLSAEQEEKEIRVESEEVKRLTADLEELKSQLEVVKNDRERVLKALNTIHKERDLFKILLCKTRQVEHLTPEIFQRMVAVACSSGPAIAGPDSSSIEREAHIEDLKKMISNLERNIESIKKELADSQAASAAELVLKNQLLEKAHIRISEVMKSLETVTERNELLESNIKALTTEFDELRTKCQKMTLELEQSHSKNEEFAELINAERKRAHDALIEASQSKEQNRQLLGSLEREKRERQQELASLFKELQDKQMREFEARTEKQLELQHKLDRAYLDFCNMQLLRNFERDRRIKLDRLLNTRILAINKQVPPIKKQSPSKQSKKPTIKRTEKRADRQTLLPQQPQLQRSQLKQSLLPRMQQPQLQRPQLQQPQLRQPQLQQPQPQQPQPQQPQLQQLQQLQQPQREQPQSEQIPMDQTQMDQTQMDQIQMDQTQMDQTQMDQIQIDQTPMDQTQLEHTQLEHAQLESTQLENTLLEHTQLENTQLENTQLEHTQLESTQMDHSQLQQQQPRRTQPSEPSNEKSTFIRLKRRNYS